MAGVSDYDVILVPADFSTIQAAVDAVHRRTTIVVDPGDYDGAVVVTAKEYVVIQSAGLSRRGVTLSAGEGDAVVSVDRATVHLSGIEIRSNLRIRGICVSDAAISLQECVIAGNRVSAQSREPFGAAMLCRRSSVHLQKSVLSGNMIDTSGPLGCGGGLYLERCIAHIAGCSVQVNAVHAAEEARGGGIWCEGTRLRMWRSRVTENSLHARSCEGAGIYFRDAEETQIGGSVIVGNGSSSGRGGGIVLGPGADGVSVHRNSAVRLNHPDDVCGDPSQ